MQEHIPTAKIPSMEERGRNPHSIYEEACEVRRLRRKCTRGLKDYL